MARGKRNGLVVVFVQQKGGSTKTSTAATLAGMSADRGQRVLYVDADQNAKGTQRLGFYPAVKDSIGAALTQWKDLRPFIQAHPKVTNLSVLPMAEGFKDETMRTAIHLRMKSEGRTNEDGDVVPKEVNPAAIGFLKGLLEEIRGDFDLIVVDTHNDRNHLSTMFWGNADVAMGATQPTVDDVGSLMTSIKFVELARKDGNQALRYLGFVINRYPFGAMAKNADRILRQVHPDLMRVAFATRLPEKPAVAEESEEAQVPHPLTPLAREGGADGFYGRSAKLYEEFQERLTSDFWGRVRPNYEAYVAWADAHEWRGLTGHVRNLVGGGRAHLGTEKTRAIQAKIAQAKARKQAPVEVKIAEKPKAAPATKKVTG